MVDYYHSKRWKKIRELVLRRDGYMSQLAKRYGKRVQADTVHHIFPREDYPEYQWEMWNLISVTHEEHEKLHDRETGKLSDEGEALMQRTKMKQSKVAGK